jgi:hypothetical protein
MLRPLFRIYVHGSLEMVSYIGLAFRHRNASAPEFFGMSTPLGVATQHTVLIRQSTAVTLGTSLSAPLNTRIQLASRTHAKIRSLELPKRKLLAYLSMRRHARKSIAVTNYEMVRAANSTGVHTAEHLTRTISAKTRPELQPSSLSSSAHRGILDRDSARSATVPRY